MGGDRQAEGEKERGGRDVSAGRKGKAVQCTHCRLIWARSRRQAAPLGTALCRRLFGDESDDDDDRVSSRVDFEKKNIVG